MNTSTAAKLLEINAYPTPGKTLVVHQLENPSDYDGTFDPHGVSGDANVCRACARDILVTAHLMSGYCSQVCRAIYGEARIEYQGANITVECDWCSETVFDRDTVTCRRPDNGAPEGVCAKCRDTEQFDLEQGAPTHGP